MRTVTSRTGGSSRPGPDGDGPAPGSGPSVSVVIPVKDDAAPLARCLAALGRQTRPPDEVIVVDNGSSDGSARLAAAAGARVVPCPAPGIPAASATGYDAARGEVILRLDADCLPAPEWIDRMMEALARRPAAAALSGGARFVDGPRPLRRPLAAVYLGAYHLAVAPALGHPPLFGSNLALRRRAWLACRRHVHREDPEVHDDLDLAFHLGERHRIAVVRDTGMGMSMLPFADGRAFLRRVGRGARTVGRHWPRDFPPVRWLRLGLLRALGRR